MPSFLAVPLYTTTGDSPPASPLQLGDVHEPMGPFAPVLAWLTVVTATTTSGCKTVKAVI